MKRGADRSAARYLSGALERTGDPLSATCREMLADLKEFRGHIGSSDSRANAIGGACFGLDSVPAYSPRPSTASGMRQSSLRQSSLRNSSLSGNLRTQIEQASRPLWGNAVVARSALGTMADRHGNAPCSAGDRLVSAARARARLRMVRAAGDHIAVLPFENVGNDPANEAVSAGLMDSLAQPADESRSRQAIALGRADQRGAPAKDYRSHRALRELGATIAVEGSLQRDGQTIHLTVNLVNTKNLRQIGSVALEDRAGDFSSLEDEAVSHMAKLMHIEVTPEMLRATGGPSMPAHTSYT